jgi:hypothetical protein
MSIATLIDISKTKGLFVMNDNTAKPDKLTEDLFSRLSWNKKSVRTTFKLSQEAIEMLASLTEGEGKTVKDFFDNVCLAFLFAENPPPGSGPGREVGHPWLSMLNDQERKEELEKIERHVRKTYVISQTALAVMAKFSKQHKISRDGFVEYAVRITKESIDRRQKEIRAKHAQAFKILKEKWLDMERTREELGTFLDTDDPIYDEFFLVCNKFMFLYNELEEELEGGTSSE